MEKINDFLMLDRDAHYIFAVVTDPVLRKQAKEIKGVEYKDAESYTLVALPHTSDGCIIARNLGIPDAYKVAPFNYEQHPLVEGMYKPMAHQLETAAFLTVNPRSYVLSDPRTGKTGSLILAMDYLQRHRHVTGGFLIVTTVTTIDSVWIESIKKTLPMAHVAKVHGRQREKALEKTADYYVTNYDSIRLSKQAFIDAVLAGRIGGVVIDELTHVGNSSSQRFKAINALVNNNPPMRVVYGVTGSPGDNPESVFGMASVINKRALPCRTKRGWIDLVTYQYGPEPYMRRPTHSAPDIIYRTLQPAIRFNKADVMDLPPVMTQTRTCDLSSEQSRIMDQLRVQALAL